MAQLNLSAADMMQALQSGSFTKVLSALQKATEKHDYDSGWQAAPAGGLFNHNLGIIPKEIHAQGSANADGSNFQNVNYSAVTANTLAVAAGQAYYRVLANR